MAEVGEQGGDGATRCTVRVRRGRVEGAVDREADPAEPGRERRAEVLGLDRCDDDAGGGAVAADDRRRDRGVAPGTHRERGVREVVRGHGRQHDVPVDQHRARGGAEQVLLVDVAVAQHCGIRVGGGEQRRRTARRRLGVHEVRRPGAPAAVARPTRSGQTSAVVRPTRPAYSSGRRGVSASPCTVARVRPSHVASGTSTGSRGTADASTHRCTRTGRSAAPSIDCTRCEAAAVGHDHRLRHRHSRCGAGGLEPPSLVEPVEPARLAPGVAQLLHGVVAVRRRQPPGRGSTSRPRPRRTPSAHPAARTPRARPAGRGSTARPRVLGDAEALEQQGPHATRRRPDRGSPSS